MANIRLREYTSLMISARRISRRFDEQGNVTMPGPMLRQLLDTLDELSGFDTSIPNKIAVRRPR